MSLSLLASALGVKGDILVGGCIGLEGLLVYISLRILQV